MNLGSFSLKSRSLASLNMTLKRKTFALALPAAPGREVHVLERGGHLGFLGRDGSGGIRWLERRLAAWILRG